MKRRPMNICEQTVHYPNGNKAKYYTISMGEYAILEDLNVPELLRLQRLINTVASKHNKRGGYHE